MTDAWARANQAYLSVCLQRLRDLLQQVAAAEENDGRNHGYPLRLPDEADFSFPAGSVSTLRFLTSTWQLSTFEINIILLCAGQVLEGDFPFLTARLQGATANGNPTPALAIALFPNSHWDALTAGARLRTWSLIHLEAGQLNGAMSLDERVLNHLLGINHMDEFLQGLFVYQPVPADNIICRRERAAELGRYWQAVNGDQVIQLCGDARADDKIALAARICQYHKRDLYRLDVRLLPSDPKQLHILALRWHREMLLGNRVLLVEGIDELEPSRQPAFHWWLRMNHQWLFIISYKRRPIESVAIFFVEVEKPDAKAQRDFWRLCLSNQDVSDSTLGKLTSQFSLDGLGIQTICRRLSQDNTNRLDRLDLEKKLWRMTRVQARSNFGPLAVRIPPKADKADLILPRPQQQQLAQIVDQVRCRDRVHDHWGFGANNSGLIAMFAGPSGTGKTMAASVLAQELALDLYRIDLSTVVNKYIGETEKNLRRIFDAAEAGGAILLFDEADALFGKRGETRDSHDRHANVEISYLLQRIETYRGLAILTTNLKQNLDHAFLRRIRFIVSFAFPGPKQREQLWHKAFPKPTPLAADLQPHRLAVLQLSGGQIHQIALNAAYLAAADNQPVAMAHVGRAVRDDYRKRDVSTNSRELRALFGADPNTDPAATLLPEDL